MKRTLALLLTIVLITIAFASCNLDGTAGIFRQISQSKVPLSIRYKQLLGIDTSAVPDQLYFRTEGGIERVDQTSKAKTTVVASKYEHIVQAASLYSSSPKVLYVTNNLSEIAAKTINVIDVSTNPAVVKPSITPLTTNISDIKKIKLLASSLLFVYGDDSGNAKFELQSYNGTAFAVIPSTTQTLASSGYSLEEVIQQTAKEQDATAPMIVSFVKGEDRIHYLVDPSGSITSLGTEKVKIANFFFISATSLVVLTTDGTLYHVNGTAWTSIGSNPRAYGANAFALAVEDVTNYHLITKPSTKTAPLHVFTITKATPSASVGSGVDVKSGYAEKLALATIVSSQVKLTVLNTSTDLLVATNESGMFDITINHADANKDTSSNGSSLDAEQYSF